MILAVLVLVLRPAPAAAPEDDVARWVERLGAPTSAERAQAQLWLGGHLDESDLPVLARAAAGPDPEVRRRIALALAADDAHVGTAVALAASDDALTAEVGRLALADRIASWAPSWLRLGTPLGETVAALADRYDRPLRLDPEASSGRIDLALDRIDRFAPGGPPLVLDPDLALADHPRERADVIVGTFEHVLDELVRVHRADAEGFAVQRDTGDPVRAWIRVGRSIPTVPETGVEHVAGWCVDLLRREDPARRSACARAVAGTGWPGGIAWLERRWKDLGDEASLDGVLLAAGRGQVAPSLAQPAVWRELLGRLPGLLGARDRTGDLDRADAIARALARTGPIGPRGEDLAAVAAERLDGASGAADEERWLRLVVLEGARASSPPAAQAIDRLLARDDLAPALGLEALRARAATRPFPAGGCRVPRAAAILAHADLASRGPECLRLLVHLGVPSSPIDPSAPPSLLLLGLEWSFRSGDTGSAAQALLALLPPADQGGVGVEALAERAREWARHLDGPSFDAAVAAARSTDPRSSERLEVLGILAGRAADEVRAKWFDHWSGDPGSREALLGLAALCASDRGGVARTLLADAVREPGRLEDATDALDRAIDVLRAARDDAGERELVLLVRATARGAAPEVRARLRVDLWPRPDLPEPIRLEDLDRSLQLSGL